MSRSSQTSPIDSKNSTAGTHISVAGARQNNLKNVDVTFPKGALTAVTGLSGSGKSSLVFDTLYAEGQRRYVESFSTYARQFLERMDRPDVDSIDGLMPAIALEQKNTIRSARATLATLTELTDFLKLLFAARSELFCPTCSELVTPDLPDATTGMLLETHAGARVVITFPFRAGTDTDAQVALAFLAAEGFHRVLDDAGKAVALDSLDTGEKLGRLNVVVDRLVLGSKDRARIVEGIELAYRMGEDDATIHVETANSGDLFELQISRQRRCCGVSYPEPRAGMFSFGSPLGACETCNGFGRVMGVDPHRVVPDHRLSIAQGALKPWRSPKRGSERSALRRACQEAGIDIHAPWDDLSDAQRAYVFEGGPGRQSWRSGWPGVDAWFAKLQRKIYRMHVRILLASYRSYTTCPDCDGKRLKPLSLLYKISGCSVADVLTMTVTNARSWLATNTHRDGSSDSAADELAVAPVISQLAQRLEFLDAVGLGYLTLNRQGRTLSGGEVQRANLTTALGSGLVNTLFVFDEPSVGLHARDADRVAQAIGGLAARDNTVVVVEHDPDVLAFADHVVELGPGPGSAGGRIVFEGTPVELALSDTATGRALRQRRTTETLPAIPLATRPAVVVRDATAQNLKGVTARFPIGHLTVVSGVSGSGKSTLIQQVLHRGILRRRGELTDTPGACSDIEGLETIGDVLWVDAAPPGSSSRANPATYMKAWDVFRGQLAKTPLAKERGYAPGTFSFNAGTGRCEACQGAGVERIEMQFLSDVLLTCEVCRGRRFKEEVLEVRWRDASAADLLSMTVEEACEHFSDHRVVKRLKPLADAGLGYLTLGQPLATLSGGESQRLKLAHHIAVTKTTGSLFLLDEPTTGQHMTDVARLIENLRALVAAGNTVVVVEHHLDVIAAAEHVVDLGPDGGDRGGQLVFEGPPSELISTDTETGRHLAKWLTSQTPSLTSVATTGDTFDAPAPPSDAPKAVVGEDRGVVVVGARVNNLKDVSVTLPRTGRTVISGVSGSGKSSLAFDLIFAEGQRRFLDCLSPYARQYIAQLGRPDADHVYGIPPTVAIEQRTTRGGRWSTVANVTEIEPFLRLLWARIGDQTWGSERGVPRVLREISETTSFKRAKTVEIAADIVIARKGEHQDAIRDAITKGQTLIIDGTYHAPEALGALARLKKTKSHDISLVIGAASTSDTETLEALLGTAATLGRVRVTLKSAAGKPLETANHWVRNPAAPRQSLDPRLFSPRTELGRCDTCEGTGLRDKDDADGPVCKTCEGSRLGPMGRSVAVDGATLPAILSFTPAEVLVWVTVARESLNSRDLAVADGPMRAVSERAQFLLDVGLGYLTLNRCVPTLSGGESQRIRLAAQLGAHLSGVLYVLDEPTIGLHPADVDVLLGALDRLQERGNGVLMVEHDERTLRTADVLIDVGPGAGVEGGEILAMGTLAEVLADPKSITGRCLSAPRPRVRPKARTTKDAKFLELQGVSHHNVEAKSLRIPRERFTVVTGVSGSGKSTVAIDVLSAVLKSEGAAKVHGPDVRKVLGSEGLERFIHVDDKPIGKNPRSTPATYVGVWDHIRTLYAKLTEAKVRGFAKSRFSFNVKGGRCEHCAGQGRIKLEMSFLPDAYMPCGECAGRRFNRQTLRVAWDGHTIADILAMPVREAAVVFDAVPKIKRPLALLNEVGLGYLQLGQSSTTLSGGEAQRVKLVAELVGRDRSDTVVVLDEPTTGLHMADVPKLVGVFHRLVDAGATVVVIEHNFDVAREADWIVDMGPGAGAKGGSVVYQGPYAGLKKAKASITAKHLP